MTFGCIMSDLQLEATCGSCGTWIYPEQTCPIDIEDDSCYVDQNLLQGQGFTLDGDAFHEYYYEDDSNDYHYFYHVSIFCIVIYGHANV